MAAKSDTWMPFYVADYLRDTMRLTRDQHGGYLLLIMAAWTEGGRLPNDPDELAAIVKATPAEWRKMAPVLLRYFDVEGDELVHRRVVEEHEKAARMAETRRQNGGKGGRPRKLPETETVTGGKPGGLASEKLDETPSPSPTEVEAEASTSVREAKASLVAGGDVPAAFALWNELAERVGLPLAKALTPERRRHIKARLEQGGLEGWQEALTGVERSKHCRGQNDRGWKADLDFVCQPKSYQRLREGTYGADMPAASGASAAPTTTWPGPPQLRAAIVAAAGEDVARGYLDPATWDGPARAVVVRNAFMADRLRREAGPTLDRLKVNIVVSEGVAA